MNETKTEFKKISLWRKTRFGRVIKRMNKEGLKGWELFSMCLPAADDRKNIFHLRKKQVK